MQNRRGYNEHDLLSNDSFLSWLNDKNTPDGALWEAWLREHPDKSQTVKNAARTYRLLMAFDKNTSKNKEREEVWECIQERLAALPVYRDWHLHFPLKTWLKYAAVVVGIICIVLAGGRFGWPEK